MCKSEEDITSFQRKVMQISPFWMQSNADITPSQLDLGVGFRCHICFCTPVHLNCIWMLSQSQLHDYLMSPLSFGAYSDASITFLVILLLQSCNQIQLVQSICDCRDPKFNPRHQEKKLRRELSFTIGISCKYIAWGINAWARFANSRGILLHPMPTPLLPTLGSAWMPASPSPSSSLSPSSSSHSPSLDSAWMLSVFRLLPTKHKGAQYSKCQSISWFYKIASHSTFEKLSWRPISKKELELQINAEAVYAVRPWICNCAFRADFDRRNILRHGGESNFYVHLLLPV